MTNSVIAINDQMTAKETLNRLEDIQAINLFSQHIEWVKNNRYFYGNSSNAEILNAEAKIEKIYARYN